MSPVGLDVSRYGFMVFEYIIADAAAHLILAPDWLVTRVQFFTTATGPGVLRFISPTQTSLGSLGVVNVAAEGCYEALPGGAHRSGVEVSGQDARVYIEYWFPANAGALVPVPVVTPP